jgi:PurA ssDNA and RNA-binding protein
MISNEYRSSLSPRPYVQKKPRTPEVTLKSGWMNIEHKVFALSLSENARGRFLRIAEDAAGHRNAIVVPSTGLEDFQRLFTEMAKVAAELPPAQGPVAPKAGLA